MQKGRLFYKFDALLAMHAARFGLVGGHWPPDFVGSCHKKVRFHLFVTFINITV